MMENQENSKVIEELKVEEPVKKVATKTRAAKKKVVKTEPETITIIYYPEKDSPPVRWAGFSPDIVALRQREISIPSNKDETEFKSLALSPGTNLDIDMETWTNAKKLPLIARLVKTGCLVEYKMTVKDKSKVKGLSGYDDIEAQEILQNTFDVAIIKKWQADDVREDMHYVYQRRLQDLDALGVL